MSRWKIFRRIWLPQAIYRALPTLTGETVLQLKSTPLVATISVIDIFAVSSKVRQDTYLTYEPLLLLALIYMTITGILVLVFSRIEARIPVKIGYRRAAFLPGAMLRGRSAAFLAVADDFQHKRRLNCCYSQSNQRQRFQDAHDATQSRPGNRPMPYGGARRRRQ